MIFSMVFFCFCEVLLDFYFQMERYNLRSGKTECYIPVQLQLARDEEFYIESLEASGHAEQVFHSD